MGGVDRWSLWGTETSWDCRTLGAVTHVRFMSNQGMLVAAIDYSRVYLWDLNKQQLIGDVLQLPGDEYSNLDSG